MAEPESQQSDGSSASAKRDMVSVAAMGVAAIASLAGFGLLFSLWWSTDISDPHQILRLASQEYVAGNVVLAGDLAETVEFATDPDKLGQESLSEDSAEAVDEETELSPALQEKLDEEKREQAEWIRVRDFLVGAGRFDRAMRAVGDRPKRQLFLDAIGPLEAAKKGGFPPGRITEGNRIIGKTYYELGRYVEAVLALRQAVSQSPQLQRELLPLIARAELRLPGDHSLEALDTITRYLNDPTLSHPQRWEAEVIRLESLVQARKYQEADQMVREIELRPRVDDVLLETEQQDFLDRIELHSCIAEVQKAIAAFGKEPPEPFADRSDAQLMLDPIIVRLGRLHREARPKTAARSKIWLARALFCVGDADEGLSQLTSVRQQRPFHGEAIVGGLEEIEYLAARGRGVEVLQTVRYMIRELGDKSGFDIGLISYEEFSRRLIEAIAVLRNSGDHANAIDTARSLPPIIELSTALIQEGIGYQQWAEATIQDGTDVSGEVARSASVLARSRYRAAGDAFEQAAKLRFDTDEYVPTLWSAIEAYQKGRHFRRSISMLETYERYEERSRLPRAFVAYGRALLAEGDIDKAIEKVETCIVEYPRDPIRYDARLLVAQGLVEKENFDKAREFLMRNLQDGSLTPQSPAWRDSLFTLGELLYQQAYQNQLSAESDSAVDRREMLRKNQPVLQDAIRYLDETVERYWPIPRAESAAYLSARAHVMASRWPREESQSPEILEAARRSLRTQADQELNIAYAGFSDLKRHLASREEEVRLPAKEQMILRNCSLAEAETLREMGRLDEAATAYRAVELRYMNEPIALEAILGRANCAKELGRLEEADLLVQQANVVLGRIPDDWNGRFEETTRFDRRGWQEYLTWMNSRISSNAS
ncbi:Tetratricopeptide repeat protein [Rubripirellula amarantea]|uniref:Tetratricopeptide repeat protein n=1 Tax=Rubripirellula amarantea TaxID=2527999 RepID=A0A5C5WT54_9BACT|nr:tetratricopeptide repeat protein [Rubripirellula amarantea]TWT53002.1 Tetratricopeptide repeat protein [Rubripirellula amarantea]